MDRIAELTEVLGSLKMVDLTHRIETDMPRWPTHTPVLITETAAYQETGSYHNALRLHEHSGTHIDAPAHFIKDGEWHVSVDDIPLERFFGRMVTLSFHECPPCYDITRADIEDWESAHGVQIKKDDVVAFDFGIDQAWADDDRERIGRDWPGLSPEAARYLRETGVKMVGTDALAIDACGAGGDPAHRELLGHGILILENLSNLASMPDVGYFMCLPLPIKGGSGCPIRAVGLKAE